jgi:hypothetical protein
VAELYSAEAGLSRRYRGRLLHRRSHSLSALNNPATSSTTFCALVHKGERYDFHTGKKWSAVAPNYGIPFGSTVLTVEIILPSDDALPNQYRDALTTVDERSPISTDDYAARVRELMPEWVKAVIREAHPPRDENLDDLQKDLQKLLDEFRLPPTTASSSTETRLATHEPPYIRSGTWLPAERVLS